MTTRPKPHVHGRDHEHGGADPTLIHWEDVGGAGGGDFIHFGSNEGSRLQIFTGDDHGMSLSSQADYSGYGGIQIWTQPPFGYDPDERADDVQLWATNGNVQIFATQMTPDPTGATGKIAVFSDGDLDIHSVNGRVDIYAPGGVYINGTIV